MTTLVLTLSPMEPLVINDAEIVVKIKEVRGNQVKVKIDADKGVALNRGKVYLNKKLSNSALGGTTYIDAPIKEFLDEDSEELIQLLEIIHENMDRYDWVTDINLPEKTQRLLRVVGSENYKRLIETFFAKFLFVTNLSLNDESVLEFKKDFLGYQVNSSNT